MNRNLAHTNTGFSYLRNSPEFLNLLLDNITSCILMLDKDVNLVAFNDAFRTIFSNKPEEFLLYKKCGDAIGCAYVVEEEKECGSTSHCQYCTLREAVLHSYMTREPVYKKRIDREFYTHDSQKEMRCLQFSTRPFYFEKEYYIIVIIDDITMYIRQEERIAQLEQELAAIKNGVV